MHLHANCDNISYVDLLDSFYVWFRRSLEGIYLELMGALVVPNGQELIATLYRHGSKESVERFFFDGITHAMQRIISP
jgi:putative DNA methylase